MGSNLAVDAHVFGSLAIAIYGMQESVNPDTNTAQVPFTEAQYSTDLSRPTTTAV